MPTCDRRPFVPVAIDCFQKQDYPHRELVIVDDGTDPIDDLVPPDPRLRYHRLSRRAVLGEKRNLACELAQGTVITHWDDDDWSPATRLSRQVKLLNESGATICGAKQILYYDPLSERAWIYDRPLTTIWAEGNTLCYLRSFWEQAPFPSCTIETDLIFVGRSRRTAYVTAPPLLIAVIHPWNSSPKDPTAPYWFRVDAHTVHQLLGDDLQTCRRHWSNAWHTDPDPRVVLCTPGQPKGKSRTLPPPQGNSRRALVYLRRQ
jgi:glycosyltransferase involved in cell wall biosynthesis